MAKLIYFESTDKIFQKFDNYEIWPCVLLDQINLKNNYESCNIDDPNIAIWCVYGHFQAGGLECVSDHETYDDANEFMETLPKMHLMPLTPF